MTEKRDTVSEFAKNRKNSFFLLFIIFCSSVVSLVPEYSYSLLVSSLLEPHSLSWDSASPSPTVLLNPIFLVVSIPDFLLHCNQYPM